MGRCRQQSDLEEATTDLGTTRAVFERLVARNPDNVEWRADLAATLSSIARTSETPRPDEADHEAGRPARAPGPYPSSGLLRAHHGQAVPNASCRGCAAGEARLAKLAASGVARNQHASWESGAENAGGLGRSGRSEGRRIRIETIGVTLLAVVGVACGTGRFGRRRGGAGSGR